MEEGEELDALSVEEMVTDPLFHAKVAKDGFYGHVDCIEVGLVSKDKLYRVQYEDGDLEHFTSYEVRKFLYNM